MPACEIFRTYMLPCKFVFNHVSLVKTFILNEKLYPKTRDVVTGTYTKFYAEAANCSASCDPEKEISSSFVVAFYARLHEVAAMAC